MDNHKKETLMAMQNVSANFLFELLDLVVRYDANLNPDEGHINFSVKNKDGSFLSQLRFGKHINEKSLRVAIALWLDRMKEWNAQVEKEEAIPEPFLVKFNKDIDTKYTKNTVYFVKDK